MIVGLITKKASRYTIELCVRSILLYFIWSESLVLPCMRFAAKDNILHLSQFSSGQLLSHIWLFATPCIAARPPCPSPTPGVHPNSCPSSRWCHSAISSSVVPFSSCPQSLPASESFSMSQPFAWGGQSTRVSALAIIPSKEHSGLISCRMDWLDLLAVQGTLKSLLQISWRETESKLFTILISQGDGKETIL